MASNFDMWRKAGRGGDYRRNPLPQAQTPESDEKVQKRLDFMKWSQQHLERYLGGQDDGAEEYPEYGPQM